MYNIFISFSNSFQMAKAAMILCLARLLLATGVTASLPPEGPLKNYLLLNLKPYFTHSFIKSTNNLKDCMSCKGLCGKTAISCSCNSECVYYNNCCPDFIELCPEENTLNRVVEDFFKGPYSKCVQTGYNKDRANLIATCPNSKIACLKPSETGDVLDLLPVADKQTRVHYINIHCALCNDIPIDNISLWKAFVDIDIRKNIYFTDIEQSSITDLISQRKAMFRPEPPDGYEQPKKCSLYVKTECSKNWPYDYIRFGCEYGPKLLIDKRYNIFCLLCNHISAERLWCIPPFYDIELPHPIPRPLPQPIPYSLQLLFRVDHETGVSLDKVCPENQVLIVKNINENTCQKLWNSTDEALPNMNVSVNILYPVDFSRVYPDEIAGMFITEFKDILSDNRTYFSVGSCVRDWKKMSDNVHVHIVTTQSALNVLQDFANSVLNVTKRVIFRNISHNAHVTVRLLVSGINKTCEGKYRMHKISSVDSFGTIILGDNSKLIPGEYLVRNGNILSLTCSPSNHPAEYIGWLTVILMSLSLICVCIHLLLYHKKTSDIRWPVIGLSWSILLLDVVFLVAPWMADYYIPCFIAGCLLHWCFLHLFTWMNVVAVDIWLVLSKASNMYMVEDDKLTARKLLLPLIPAFLVVAVAIVLHFVPVGNKWQVYYNRGLVCFLNNKNYAVYLLLIMPGGLSILITTILTSMNAVRLYKIKRESITFRRSYFFSTLKLWLLTGATWILGFVAIPTDNDIVFVLFVAAVASQGIWILTILWLKKCRLKVSKYKGRNENNVTSTNNTENSGSHL